MTVEHVAVAVQDDFIERQTRAQTVGALAELIWNGLDGDAIHVQVEFEHNDLAGGLSKIAVYDDGVGFPRCEAVWQSRWIVEAADTAHEIEK